MSKLDKKNLITVVRPVDKYGFFYINGQKTSKAIEKLCDESEIASKQTLANQYF